MIQLFNAAIGYCCLFAARIGLLFCASLRKNYQKIHTSIQQQLHNQPTITGLFPDTLILAEDHRFRMHKGVDAYAIVRAIVNYIFKKRLEGASTIGQQLVRTIIKDRRILLKRKLKEIFLSVLIDSSYEKDELLSCYIHIVTKHWKGVVFNPQNHVIEIAIAVSRFKYIHLTRSNFLHYLKRVRKVEKLMTNNGMVHDSFKFPWNPIPPYNNLYSYKGTTPKRYSNLYATK
jgi:hypothetical protein